MKALYNNHICYIVEVSSDVTLCADGRQFVVSLADEGLVIDPTDSELADADNFPEWCGLEAEAAERFRAMLRGEVN